jgi:hypothetical protein
MRYAMTLCLALFLAATVNAQQRAASPDYSRQSLQQIFVNTPLPDEDRVVDARDVGMIDVNAGNTQLHFAYLPFLAPLTGSVPGTTRVWPTAFALLNVDFPGGAPVVVHTREVARELRRINAIDHRHTDVVVIASE